MRVSIHAEYGELFEDFFQHRLPGESLSVAGIDPEDGRKCQYEIPLPQDEIMHLLEDFIGHLGARLGPPK